MRRGSGNKRRGGRSRLRGRSLARAVARASCYGCHFEVGVIGVEDRVDVLPVLAHEVAQEEPLLDESEPDELPHQRQEVRSQDIGLRVDVVQQSLRLVLERFQLGGNRLLRRLDEPLHRVLQLLQVLWIRMRV